MARTQNANNTLESIMRPSSGICIFFDLLGAYDVGGPVAAAAHGVEGEVRGALVLPTGDALASRPSRTHDEFAARVRMRKDADVVTNGFAIRENFDL